MILYNIDIISEDIKIWITNIKQEYQIKEYYYSNDFLIGWWDNNKIILNVETKPPKPTIIYKVIIKSLEKEKYKNNNKLNNYITELKEHTLIIN